MPSQKVLTQVLSVLDSLNESNAELLGPDRKRIAQIAVDNCTSLTEKERKVLQRLLIRDDWGGLEPISASYQKPNSKRRE